MVKRHLELRFLLQMAGIAKFRLGLGQQKLFRFRVVRRMAGDAAHVVLRVQRVDGVHVLRSTNMAGHAARIDVFCRGVLEGEDFGYVAAAGDVLRTGPMATFAALVRGAAFGVEGGFPVRRFLPAVVDFLVTGLAGLRSYVFGCIGRLRIRRWRSACGCALRGRWDYGCGRGLRRSV